jgi:uncharacterized protein
MTADVFGDRREQASASPIDPSKRIDAIDVLRGLALFGILAVNLITEFRVSIFEQFLPSSGTQAPLDVAVSVFLKVFVQSKAFALFSLLFGIGLAIQFERLDPQRRTLLLVRRLAVLLAIGLVHLFLIWNGDILTEYAIAGFFVLPFLFGPRWLLAAGGLFFLGVYLVNPLPSELVSLPDAKWMTQHVAEAGRVYGTGGFLETLAFRIHEVPFIFPLHAFVFPRTIALFLFGAFVWRTGILRRERRGLLLGVALAGIVAGLGLTLAADGYVFSGSPTSRRAIVLMRDLAPVLLAFGYGAAVIGLMSLSNGRKMLVWAAPIGRMAFTNYLVQSLVLGWLFYGYGLGLFGRLGPAAALLIAIALYAAQAMLSASWLKRYWYGPVEWLWRALMYGLAPPMRRAAKVVEAQPGST